MDGDISKRTIMVLVVLTVIISVLGTLSVMSAVADLQTEEPAEISQSTKQGYVALRIEGPEDYQVSGATGKVSLEILPPPKPNILLLPE